MAFRILELSTGATLEDVSGSFRRLLKLYHPDRNLDRVEWSHRKTVELTQAYEAATDFLRSSEAPHNFTATATAQPVYEPSHSETHQSATDLGYSVSLQLRLATEFDLLLDQLYSYYSFGLDKIHLRTEGSLRYRYRNTLRRLSKVIQNLIELREWPGSENQYSQVDLVHSFAAAFYENMLIKPHPNQVPVGNERKAYQFYRQGSESLDEAIKARLFDDFRTRQNSPASRSTAERAFMLILAHFPKSPYTAETLIKYYLLEAFGKLCEVLDEA